MGMESDQPDDVGNGIKETSIKHLFYPGSPDASNLFGEQQVSPRVGDEYQVQIPSMAMEPEHLNLLGNPADSKVFDGSLEFLVGLPVPIIWSDGVNNIEDTELESPSKADDGVNGKMSPEVRKCKKNRAASRKKSSELKVEPLEFGLDHGEDSKVENPQPVLADENSNQFLRSKCCYPVPDSLRGTWSDSEVDVFVLGIYIFGKNLYQVKRFMEHKHMGEILSFYYGRFYRSDAHRRWAECRKIRRRKCVTGEKIFTGWRQRELLSRMIPHVPEEIQKTLPEGYKSFAEGKTSLEEYVSFLKSTVGIQVLVEAVGIGKGKEDLTGVAMEPEKNNQDSPVASKLPTGKAFSSLTFGEIVQCLTGGFRLSKGRSNDIFWEAVWPRLLANGWHSEEPKKEGYVSFKQSLVFLMPGVKKFSKRKLTKGDHFFDSVSDVLNKVASETKLLQLEGEEYLVGSWNEGGLVPEATSDQDVPSSTQRHCYLKPRVSTRNPKLMKFTVVDTSLVHRGKSCGITELRYVPVENKANSVQTNSSSENDEDDTENKLNEVENDTAEMPLKSEINTAKPLNKRKFTIVDTSLAHGGTSSKVTELRCSPVVECVSPRAFRETEGNSCADLLDKHKLDATDISLDGEVSNSSANCHTDTYIGGANQMGTANNADAAEKIESLLDRKTTVSDNKQRKRAALGQFSGREKYKHSKISGRLTKQRRLTACVKSETNCVLNCSPELELEPDGTLNTFDAGELVVSLMGPQEKESSVTSLDEGSQVKESSLETHGGNSSSLHVSCGKNEKHRTQELSELNLPRASLEETNAESSLVPSKRIKHVKGASSTSGMDSRRQSTRNRPITARALEALADGFLTVKKRKRRPEVCIDENPFSSCSPKPRRIKVTSSHADTGVVAPEEEIKAKEDFDLNKEAVSKPLDPIGEKWLTSY